MKSKILFLLAAVWLSLGLSCGGGVNPPAGNGGGGNVEVTPTATETSFDSNMKAVK